MGALGNVSVKNITMGQSALRRLLHDNRHWWDDYHHYMTIGTGEVNNIATHVTIATGEVNNFGT